MSAVPEFFIWEKKNENKDMFNNYNVTNLYEDYTY